MPGQMTVTEYEDYLLRNVEEKDLIVVLDKADDACVVVTATEWRGQLRVDVREYWCPPERPSNPRFLANPDGHFVPTKKGVAIPLGQLDKFLEAVMGWRETNMRGSIVKQYEPGEFSQTEEVPS